MRLAAEFLGIENERRTVPLGGIFPPHGKQPVRVSNRML
jgi:hypothetical protein